MENDRWQNSIQMFENIAPIFKDEFTHDRVSFIYLGSTFKLKSILYLTLQSAFLPLTLSKKHWNLHLGATRKLENTLAGKLHFYSSSQPSEGYCAHMVSLFHSDLSTVAEKLFKNGNQILKPHSCLILDVWFTCMHVLYLCLSAVYIHKPSFFHH